MKKIFSAFIIAILLTGFCANILVVSAVTAKSNENLTQSEQNQPDCNCKKERKRQPNNDVNEDEENEKSNNNKPTPRPPRGKGRQAPPKYGNATPSPIELDNIQAKGAFLMDCGSGKELFSQNATDRYPIASMCKIMSLIIIYERMEAGDFNEDDEITISENASGMGGSQVFLETNGKYKVSDLIKSIIVASANDATVAMAELIAGSEDGFVVLMNKRAKELNMTNTNFVNCTGLPQPEQYSCAKDCAVMLKQLISHKGYFKYSRIWMDKIPHSEGRITEISNTNKLIRFYKGCDGGKTGYTSEAKHCITATAERNGMRLISVIIGAQDSKCRFKEASKMLNFGFANYTSKQLVFDDKPLDININVKGGKEKTLSIVAEENYSILNNKFEKKNFCFDYCLPDVISAPVKKGDIIGKMSVIMDNEIVKEINVLAYNDIIKNTYGDCINDILNNW